MLLRSLDQQGCRKETISEWLLRFVCPEDGGITADHFAREPLKNIRRWCSFDVHQLLLIVVNPSDEDAVINEVNYEDFAAWIFNTVNQNSEAIKSKASSHKESAALGSMLHHESSKNL